MPKYQETAEDLGKKYHHTFVLYDGKAVFISAFQLVGKEILANIAENEGTKPQPQIIDPTKIEPLIFDSMFVNNSKLKEETAKKMVPATLFTRNPRRQWRRGLTDENCRLSCPLAPLYRGFGKRLYNWDGRLSFQLIRHLQKPVYPSLQKALSDLESWQALAISPMFAVTLSSISSTRQLLASTFGFIGEVQNDTIFVHHRPALQEVRDYVNRTRQSINVELVNA